MTGYAYLIGIATAVPFSVYLSLTHSTLACRFFLLTLAAAWTLTTAVAFAAVRNRNIQLHREWMVRSYAITTTFVTTRVLTAIPAIGGGGEEIYVPAQWSFLVVMMVVVELGLVWRSLTRHPSQPVAGHRSHTRQGL
jgi:uncharacterized membrane protein YozB (DUF420 family)